MKGAMNEAGAVRDVEATGDGANTRDQIFDRRRSEITECGFKRNATGFG
jgi:hypothetical protein